MATVWVLVHLFLSGFGVPVGHLGLECGTYPAPYVEVCKKVPIPAVKPARPLDP